MKGMGGPVEVESGVWAGEMGVELGCGVGRDAVADGPLSADDVGNPASWKPEATWMDSSSETLVSGERGGAGRQVGQAGVFEVK